MYGKDIRDSGNQLSCFFADKRDKERKSRKRPRRQGKTLSFIVLEAYSMYNSQNQAATIIRTRLLQ
jgi:hypothetical protein